MSGQELGLVALGAFLSFVFGAIFEASFRDLLRRAFIRIFGRFIVAREKQTLSGHWQMRDWRDGARWERRETETDDAVLYQLGDRVWGTFTSRGRKYELHGRVEGNQIFTGVWSEAFAGVAWHGAFQFKILHRAASMTGRWVGVSKNWENINHGEWEWKRPAELRYPSGEEFGVAIQWND